MTTTIELIVLDTVNYANLSPEGVNTLCHNTSVVV